VNASNTKQAYEKGKFDVPQLPFYLMMLATVLFCLSSTIAETDLWGHLKFGLDFLAAGKVFDVDPYSYVNGQTRWLDHEWLAEIFFALAYKTGGIVGLSILRLSLIGILFALLIWPMYRLGLPLLASGWLIIITLMEVTSGISTLRPQLFTYLLFALELLILQQADSAKSKTNLLWLLPVMTVFWVNLHGGVLAGIGLLFIWTAVRILTTLIEAKKNTSKFIVSLEQAVRNNITWISVLLLTIVVTGVTPYGFDLIQFLVQTGTVPRPEIPEWQPLHLVSISGAAYLMACIYTVWIVQRKMLSESPVSAIVLIILALLPFLAQRHLPLAGIAICVLSAPALAKYFSEHEKVARRYSFSLPNAQQAKAFGILAYVTALVMIVFTWPNVKAICVPPSMPAHAVSILKQSGVTGNMACYFDWGEYCIWHLHPNIKVSIDGRRETAYGKRAYQENVDFTYGVAGANALLTEEKTDLALVSKHTASYLLLKLQPAWKLLYEDDEAAIFARAGSEQEAKIQQVRICRVGGQHFFP
jgi:hypothetical protein